MRKETAEESSEMIEKVVHISRVAKVVKGGKNFSFRAVVVVGNGKGGVGLGIGKAREVPAAINKAVEKAKKTIKTYPIYRTTIPHEILGKHKGGKVLLKPAMPGTGVIAGGPVRMVMEALGVKDILAKSLGSGNPLNIIYATFNGLDNISNIKKVSEIRDKKPADILRWN